MDKNEISKQIKELIITALNLEDMSPDDIDQKAPLFKDGLGLDSIDALELGMEIKKNSALRFPNLKTTAKYSFQWIR